MNLWGGLNAWKRLKWPLVKPVLPDTTKITKPVTSDTTKIVKSDTLDTTKNKK
ncbi:MAG: hypothetical protein PHE49_02560 [bacterium]|nr:hypothetical protein [bacterium]